ncbi:hypothetical protein G7Y89_g3549 [Cudoniella acicularis]|uniref:Heterokaryon incompatibility domain-containing protein n=1 Tax=Cudoniella acicularis TaxID=354080 RepID=A0A8H4W534_9HELO|nr:hypothetical protein G7Y89_g3549 [Cudoniella acicularis]
MNSMARKLEMDSLLYQINHIFLPPQLPNKEEKNVSHERSLHETVYLALQLFEKYFPSGQRPEVDRCIRMMRSMICIRDANGFLDPTRLDDEIMNLSDKDSLAIHIRSQNAGLVVTKIGAEIQFESFELLARSQDAMGCKGRLHRRFPGPAMAVKHSLIADPSFRQPFIDVLVKLDRETGPRSRPQVNENGIFEETGDDFYSEIDTVDPWRVTEMRFPARQQHVSLYKDFMVFLMSHILNNCAGQNLSHDLLFVMTAKISRRLLKLGYKEETPWFTFARKSIKNTELFLQNKWDIVESGVRDTLDLSGLQSLDFHQDTLLSMDTLRPYLKKISSQKPNMESSKTEVIEGDTFRRNEKGYLPNGKFSQDKELLFFELADFERWVELNLDSHRNVTKELPFHKNLSSQELLPPPPPGAEYGIFAREVAFFPVALPEGFHIGPTETDDGYFNPGIESTEVEYLDNFHRQLRLLESGSEALGSVDDKWNYFTDNTFSLELFKRIEGLTTTFPRRTSPRLCNRCSEFRIFDPNFEVYLSLYKLKETTSTCELCTVFYGVLQPSGTRYPIRPMRVYREGSNLKFDDQPVLRICAGPEWEDDQDIQIGFPTLPKVGSPVHFTLLREWLRVCDEKHAKFGCTDGDMRKPGGWLPTRVLDVGENKKRNLLRLHCTKSTDRGEYIALSHCWGKPTSRERERSCTFQHNISDREEGIDFDELAETFQDAVTVTRELGKRYLWIDSLCIIQDNRQDWEREAKLMEAVFSTAYCTIAATSAKGSTVGFLGDRPVKRCLRVPNTSKNAVYFCETVDNFRGDVEEGVLNQRGWVFQERALSRRIIHFSDNQTYFECGQGVHCETLGRMKNPQTQLLGDPQFPKVALRRNHSKRIQLFSLLFETYSKLRLTVATDRSFALSGLQKRLAKNLDTELAWGIIKCYLHRSILWRRAGDKMMKRIAYPPQREVPSWSWMAYEGGISYMDIPPKQVEWTDAVRLCDRQMQSPNNAIDKELRGLAIPFSFDEMGKEMWRLVFDERERSDLRALKCIVVGREELAPSINRNEQAFYTPSGARLKTSLGSDLKGAGSRVSGGVLAGELGYGGLKGEE